MKINCIDAEDFLKDIYILPQNGEARNMTTQVSSAQHNY